MALTIKPMAGGEDPPADDPPKDDPKPDDPRASDEDDEDDDKVKPEDDYKEKARKHENWAKRERRKREDLERKLKEREDADKSEQEKAIEAAREEGRREASTEAEKARRSDRLEVAVTRLASKGVTVGDGDDKKTLRFADPEDALLHVARGDIEDLFDDDGKVKNEALEETLVELLRRKSHLAANGGERKPGDADTRKGDPANKDLEAMSPADHEKRKYPNTK